MNVFLSFSVIVWNILSVLSVSTLVTTPSSSTCLTTGITNLLVEIKFEKQTTTQCTWIYGGTLETFQFYISGLGGGCQADGTGGGDTITCAEETIDGIDHITTNLTIGGPLAAGTLTLALDCISTTATDIITPSASRSIASCSVDNDTYSEVTGTCASTCEYNDNANLSCVAGYEGSNLATTCGGDCTFADNVTCSVTTSTATSTADTTLQVTTTPATTSTVVATTAALTTTYHATTTTSPTSPVTTTPATTSTTSATTAVTTTPATTSTTSATTADFQADNSLNDSVIYSGSNTTDSNAGEAHILFLPWSLLCYFHILYFLLLQIHH
ncbi:uncharacterized protein LOC143446560 isoform X3 [Clavelina lepadiformis]|uniref:uncharacterized protein LOC143446560 isoform X3 n=1 Tax=Clavelina lepadiformis TaxID=159417 RepID=UPI0040414F11